MKILARQLTVDMYDCKNKDLSNYEELKFTSGWTRAACVSYYLSEIKNNKYSNNNVKDK